MIRPTLLAAAALLAVPAHAAPFQDTAQLDKAVAAFTGVPIGQTGGARASVDPRLKLAQCATIMLTWRADNHDAVVIRCPDPDWRLYVPVLAAPSAAAAAPAPVAWQRPAAALPPVIKRGDPVTIAAQQAGFSITRDGIALGDAPPGGRFMVRVDDARTPVQAIALQPGQATLPGWSE